MSSNLSATEENYLKAIYRLQQESGGKVSTNELAKLLQTSPASVTDMLKKLKSKKLIQYQPYKKFCLHAEGKRKALSLIRRHRLWESFLVNALQFQWHEVHSMAEELEHINEPKLVEKIDSFLHHPRFDPHGEPIPDERGKLLNHEGEKLSQLSVHAKALVVAVGSQSEELLKLLSYKKILLGSTLFIKNKHAFDGSLEVNINETLQSVFLSKQLAEFIYVKQI